MANDGIISSRQLAGIVRQLYGARLSSQEALLLHLLVTSDGWVSYDDITKRLWRDRDQPLDPSRAIHLLIYKLRNKVPALEILCWARRGYRLDLELPHGDDDPQGH